MRVEKREHQFREVFGWSGAREAVDQLECFA
jgi:hypothetical protein